MGLRHVILAAIGAGPRTGYDIARWIEHNRDLVWTASHQQAYRDLSLLVEQNLATVSMFADKKIYAITPAGRSELERWLATDTSTRVNSDVMAKLITVDVVGGGPVLEMVDREIQSRQERLVAFTKRSQATTAGGDNGATGHRLEWLFLQRCIREEQLWLRWLDEVKAELGTVDIRDSQRSVT